MSKRDSSCVEPADDTEVSFKRRQTVLTESDVEYDHTRIQARLKQIGYGKNTVAYDNYISKVPKDQRKGYNEHPRTPNAYEKQSKRMFDGKLKAWRRLLHKWDPNAVPPKDPSTLAKDDCGNIVFPLRCASLTEPMALSDDHDCRVQKSIHSDRSDSGAASSNSDRKLQDTDSCAVATELQRHEVTVDAPGDEDDEDVL